MALPPAFTPTSRAVSFRDNAPVPAATVCEAKSIPRTTALIIGIGYLETRRCCEQRPPFPVLGVSPPKRQFHFQDFVLAQELELLSPGALTRERRLHKIADDQPKSPPAQASVDAN